MKILVIQTSFLGDVITATAVLEKLHHVYPAAHLDMLVRKGNESLLDNHPFINKVWVWNKKQNKISGLLKLVFAVRRQQYDFVINLHRFASSGLITAFSGSKDTHGFKKNPLSFLFTKSFPHHIGDGTTEYQRNQSLIADLTDDLPANPRLYPSKHDYSIAQQLSTLNSQLSTNFVCITPASVWFTKQLPAEKWAELIKRIPADIKIFLTGSKDDFEYAQRVVELVETARVENLCGQLSLLQSAALMSKSRMNYVNDSAALHISSAMNAPVTAFYLSTVPRFGFVPVSDDSHIVETKLSLDCRPCGLHGYHECPKGHFKCALSIDMNLVQAT